jgi:hypothetical protein
MNKRIAVAVGSITLFAALACGTLVPPTPTPPPATVALPSDTPVPPMVALPSDTPVPPTVAAATDTPAPSGPCEFTPSAGVTVYFRPSLAADVFGSAPPGEMIIAGARTADGWLGFEPGVAQAANIGVFRNRWVQETDPNITLSGDCAGLPVVVGPTVGVCYDMPMEDVPVYQTTDTTSAVITTLHVQDYAALVGVMGADWAQVDLSQGNTGQSGLGWIESLTLNMNGPCDSLPEVAL